MPVNKVEMSLDEIIKENKKKEQKEKVEGRGKRGQAPQKSGAIRRRSGGVAKKQGASPPKKNVRGRGPVRAQQGGSRPLVSRLKSTQKTAATQATKKLVQKLVKKALRTNLVRTQPVVRNVVRRGGVRVPRKVAVLNRVNARSRVIARRQPITAPAVRGRGQVRFQQNPPAIIRRRTIIRPMQVVEQPVRRFNRRPARQFVDPAQNSIRSQLMALRQQQAPSRQRVVYVQQPQPRQQVVYVQQQPRRRQQQVVVQRSRPQQSQFFRQPKQQRRNNRNSNNNNDVFYEPRNFLQRI